MPAGVIEPPAPRCVESVAFGSRFALLVLAGTRETNGGATIGPGSRTLKGIEPCYTHHSRGHHRQRLFGRLQRRIEGTHGTLIPHRQAAGRRSPAGRHASRNHVGSRRPLCPMALPKPAPPRRPPVLAVSAPAVMKTKPPHAAVASIRLPRRHHGSLTISVARFGPRPRVSLRRASSCSPDLSCCCHRPNKVIAT